MATLGDFDIKVEVTDGPNREEMFDANRLAELGLKCEFKFYITDESWQLYFMRPDDTVSMHVRAAYIELEAQILSCEPMSADGTEWMVKLAMYVPLTSIQPDSTSFFTERLETRIAYSTKTRHGEPRDRKFVQKFMRYYDSSDKNNPNGLWFTRYIARLPEEPFVANLNWSITELDLTSRAYNGLFGVGLTTIGDLVKHTRRELGCIRNIGEKTLDEIEVQLKKGGLELRT